MWSAVVLTLILGLLSALHWYWTLGGRAGLSVALPQAGGKRLFEPGPPAIAAVALLLLLAAYLCAAQAGLAGLSGSVLSRVGVVVLAVLFALRAVGDFRHVGLFKRNRGTPFSRMDTRVFTPLCILVSALCSRLLYVTG